MATPGYPPDRNAPVERLTPELRANILDYADEKTRNALLAASPVYYRQDRSHRMRLLCGPLEKELGSVTVDAWAVNQSDPKVLHGPLDGDKVSQFLESYRAHRSSGEPFMLSEIITKDNAKDMIKFNNETIHPIKFSYQNWAMGNFLGSKTPPGPAVLSSTENTRVLRGMYRFQLACNLFGARAKWETDRPHTLANLRTFIRMFAPWEVEEIAAIHDFAKEKYGDILSNLWPSKAFFSDSEDDDENDGSDESDGSDERAETFLRYDSGEL